MHMFSCENHSTQDTEHSHHHHKFSHVTFPTPPFYALLASFLTKLVSCQFVISSCSSLAFKPFLTSELNDVFCSTWVGLCLPSLLLSHSLLCLSNYWQFWECPKIFIPCLSTCMKLLKSGVFSFPSPSLIIQLDNFCLLLNYAIFSYTCVR